MIHLHIPVGTKQAYFETYFRTPVEEMINSHKLPCVLVVPGGAYRFTSDRESEPVALAFCGKGFHAAVLRYSIDPSHFPESLCELSQTVAWIRDHAAEYSIDPDRIYVVGFSAGGHLAGSLGVYWNTDFLHRLTGLTAEQIKPDRMILCYPVTKSGAHAHRGSVEHLMGVKDGSVYIDEFDLPSHVCADTPPCFIWTSITDAIVPMENTLVFADALRKNRIPFEMHVFSEGPHGAALSNWITDEDETHGMVNPVTEQWLDLCCDWLLREIKKHEL